MSSWCFLDVLRMFARCFQDVFRMLRWVLWTWWNLMIISNESMDFNDPREIDESELFDDPSYSMIPAILWSQLFDDPQLFDDLQLFDEVWTLIIQKSTVIPPSLMVLLTTLKFSISPFLDLNLTKPTKSQFLLSEMVINCTATRHLNNILYIF